MAEPALNLPAGHRLARFERLDSTMSEAERRARAGEESGLWIWALEQDEGRGRGGRDWESRRGNLFTSLLLRPLAPLPTALQLSLVAGVALHDAAAALGAGQELAGDLALKWPNDLLLSGRKVAGILLESLTTPHERGLAVIVGTGLNLVSHPAEALYPAGSLAERGVRAEPGQALEALAAATDRWLARWDEGEGFEAVRKAWLERSIPLGAPLRIKLDGKEVIGVYAGIDRDGALRLGDGRGAERRVSAGDVFIAS